MDASATFYQTLTGMSFTLLGLWFSVMQFSHGRWRSDPDMHATTQHLALKFFLPGVLGLAALLASANDGGLVWRVSFLVGGLIGVIESVRYLLGGTGPRGRLTVRSLALADPVLYALVVAAALIPAGLLALTPLQVEGIATGLLFVSGLFGVWVAFAERAPAPAPAPPA